MDTEGSRSQTEIFNYLEWDSTTASAGQPEPAQLEWLHDQGVRWIINLGLLGTDYSLADEAGLVVNLGMRYEHIPVVWEAPRYQDFAAFVAVMRESEAEKRLIHCAMNFRASVFVALYYHLERGLAWQAVLAKVHEVWQPEPVWREFISQVLKYKSSKD